MKDLPTNIMIDMLPGPKRGEWPALYFRDEVTWSPHHTRFALAYSICEASMNNEVGCLLWGRLEGTHGIAEQNITQMVACCWRSPWCCWLDEDVFVFKAQRYDGRINRVPLIVAHATAGFYIVPGSNDARLWIDRVQALDGIDWVPWNEAILVKMIESAN
jgi:hypothetical protein